MCGTTAGRPRPAIHALYRRELRLVQNLFLPSVERIGKERVGARVRRRYDAPCTLLERVLACLDLRPEMAVSEDVIPSG